VARQCEQTGALGWFVSVTSMRRIAPRKRYPLSTRCTRRGVTKVAEF